MERNEYLESVVAKSKKKERFEREINKELAKRNANLQRQLDSIESKLSEFSTATDHIDKFFQDIIESLGRSIALD